MIKVILNSKETIINEEHLCTIKFGLEDVLETYKTNFSDLDSRNYDDMTGEEIHIMKNYKNKIYDTENLLKELDEAIEIIRRQRE